VAGVKLEFVSAAVNLAAVLMRCGRQVGPRGGLQPAAWRRRVSCSTALRATRDA